MGVDVILVLGEKLDSNGINHYITLVSFTILVYDYLLTLSLEVERFWSSPLRFGWAAGFFFLNRYMVLVGHIPVMMEFFWVTGYPDKVKICHEIQTYHQYIAIAVQVVVAAMLIMRMYALYERSRLVLAIYLTLSASVVAIACWAVLGGKMNTKPPDIIVDVGCGITLTHNQAIRLAAAWSGMLIFDSLVFGMTLYKSLTLPRTVDLLSLLLRDGAIYFGVMIAANIANILTFILGGPFTRGVATTFTNIISSVMISHLMLNLRAPSLIVNVKGSGGHRTPADTTFPGLSFVGPGETTYPQRTMANSETSVADMEAGGNDEGRKMSRKLKRRSAGSFRSIVSARGGFPFHNQCDDGVELELWRPRGNEKQNNDEEKWEVPNMPGGEPIATAEGHEANERAGGLLESYDYVARGPGRPNTLTWTSGT